MKRYSEYKDSGVKWIGEIPEHWDLLRAKNIFERQFRPVRDCDEVVTCFRDGQVTLRKNRRVEGFTESLKEIGYQGIRKGDLVIHQMDAFAGSIGVSDSDGKGTPVYICCLPKDSNNVNVYFYAYLLREMARSGFIKSLYRGIRERSSDFRFDTFAVQWLLLVPIEEQQEIVTYLDSKVAKIDEYISIAEKKIAALEELKQTIIAEAVTRGIHKDVPMKDSGVKWIGMIPEHWDLKRTAMLFSENRKKNINYEFDHALKFNYGKLVSKNEIGDVSSLKETYMAYTVINKNDIAINCLNLNYDFVSQRVAISPQKGIITSAYLIITPRQGVEAMYYNYLFKAMDSKKLFHGMGTGIRLTLSFSELKKQQIPVPPLPEQQEIVTYLDSKVANINQLCQTERAQIEKLKEYKQRLISDVVTGKVKVMND